MEPLSSLILDLIRTQALIEDLRDDVGAEIALLDEYERRDAIMRQIDRWNCICRESETDR